jgi:DNA-binding NarL/FixJ family response regulator
MGAGAGDAVIRLLVADDHVAVRRGVIDIVERDGDVMVIGQAGTADELLTLAHVERPDAIVLDITMPGRSGLQALRDLRRDLPDVPVLVLSLHPDDQYARGAFSAGASGYLVKERAPDELVDAIRGIVADRCVHAGMTAHLATPPAGDARDERGKEIGERQ